MVTVATYSFEGKIDSVAITSKGTSCSQTRDGEEVKVDLVTSQSSKNVDPYAFPIRLKEEYFKGYKTVGHIPREISRQVYYFIKTEGGFINETVTSKKFVPSEIPAGGLEIPFFLNFLCYKQATFL